MSNLTINNLGDVKPVVVAGGKTGNFVPNLNSSFYDDEFYFNLNRKDKTVTSENITTVKGKTRLYAGDDVDVFHVDDKGRMKWDIEFSEKPKSNIITWQLKYHKDVEFIRQNALTEEEIKQGRARPDDVVGSYAVYCNKKNGKYKTGKLCHIYRPFCIDANGKKIFADLLIDEKSLTITIPQDYLDNAAYPVTLDPTLGYTTAGASNIGANSWGLGFIASTDETGGNVQSFHAAINYTDSCNIKMCIAPLSSGSPSGQNPLEQVAFTTTNSDNCNTAASGSTALAASTSYAVLVRTDSWVSSIKYDSGGTGGLLNFTPNSYADSFSSPLESGWSSDSDRFSVWVTYTAAASGHPAASRLRNISRNKYVRYH